MTSAAYAVRDQRCALAWLHARGLLTAVDHGSTAGIRMLPPPPGTGHCQPTVYLLTIPLAPPGCAHPPRSERRVEPPSAADAGTVPAGGRQRPVRVVARAGTGWPTSAPP